MNETLKNPKAWLSPVVYLSSNWVSFLGVAAVTTATIFWLSLFPTTFSGHAANPYIGILAFLGLPLLFFAGLILIPLGMWWKRKRERKAGSYPNDFPAVAWRSHSLRRLVYFIAGATFVNVIIASQLTYSAVTYMDSVSFCGQTCHTIMQPEFTAYQNSPHARVECVQCHIGPGASWFVRSKLSGVGQVFATAFHTYPRPIPVPVRNLRPARETCEACHWPQKYGADRVEIIPNFADDEHNTLTRTVLLLKIGGGERGVGIHGAHIGPGVIIRYAYSDGARQIIPWVEYSGPKGKQVYATAGARAEGLPIREMDCIDCHNRPSHTFELPERAVARAMNDGQISASLPFARKKAVEILKAAYLSPEQATRQIPAAFQKFYQDKYPQLWSENRKQVMAAAQVLLALWSRNVFPDMKVTWGTYPNNLGHTDFPGCFRCHDGAHMTAKGQSISQDCDACHTLLAMDEANPKILTDLGVAEAKR